jgi:AcrR family transcriptional regulator
MAHRYDHIRQKAISLRTEQHLTLDEIVERLSLPKTTIYHWIKDIPIPTTEKQTAAQRQRAESNRARHAALREAAYQQGLLEALALLQDLSFRDFVVLYMAEGTKRQRNTVEFVNSDAQMIHLANRWLRQLARNKIVYRLQYHVDHDVEELKQYWAGIVEINPDIITVLRKSNSGQLARRQFRSQYGLLSVSVGDTYLRAKLQAWMDTVKAQW